MIKDTRFHIRKLQETDYEVISLIFNDCYGALDTFWSKEQISTFIKAFPDGQIVAEIDGRITACALSLLSTETNVTKNTYAEIIADGIAKGGDILYCMEIFVHPKFRGSHIARKIYDYRKRLCKEMNLMGIMLSGRIPNYHNYNKRLSVDEYVERVKSKEIFDPVLTCQLNNDFHICDVKHDYFNFDTESLHNAVLLKWENKNYIRRAKVAVIGTGNVGVAIAADLSVKGNDVTLIKTSSYNNIVYDRLKENDNKVWLKESNTYIQARINDVTKDVRKIADADIVFCTIQSGYYKDLVDRIERYVNGNQIFVLVCSYASSYYFQEEMCCPPKIVEAIEPYLEGRIELEDKIGEVVFRIGCRQKECPASYISSKDGEKLCDVFPGFKHAFLAIETALLNPNMVLHTVGSIMSLSRIEYSKGNFCMYREAYARGNDATLRVMLKLDKEKQRVLKSLGLKYPSVFEVGGFKKEEPLESFYRYSESSNRAISPTSVHSRYITEDVSQGLVLLESIGKRIGLILPVTSSLINLASVALDTDFRVIGRTIEKLGIVKHIDKLYERAQ